MIVQNRFTHRITTAVKYGFLAAGGILVVFPFFWMLTASLMTSTEIQRQPPVWFPETLQFSNYTNLLAAIPLGRFYVNSLFVTTARVIGVLITSSAAGFAFAKYRFPGRQFLFYLILATMMIPFFVTLIPVFFITRQLQWINTYQALIVPGLFSAYGIFMMRQFISTLPDELIDAARIDGASEVTIYLRVIVPLITPALATLGTFNFISSWNEFLWPLLITNSRDLMTIPLGLNSLSTYASEARNTHLLMAGTAAAVLPALLVFAFLQRYFVQGITLTGIKG